MRRISLLLSALVVIGCASDGSSTPLTLAPTDASVAGTYSLTSDNGLPLPQFAFLTTTEEWDITSSLFVIGSDNTWSETIAYAVSSLSTSATRVDSTSSGGTYAIANGQINFTITQGSITFPGSVTGVYLSVLYNGGHFIYQRP